MASKINNIPAYIVYDRSMGVTPVVSIVGTGKAITQANINNWRDNNLSTYWQLSNAGTTAVGSGGYQIIFDFSKQLFNVQVSYKITSIMQDAVMYGFIEYTTDNITWVSLNNSVTPSNNLLTIEESKVLLCVRSLKITFRTDSAESNIASSTITKLYELRLMGSS